MSKEVATVEEVTAFCNRVRKAGGGKQIKDLLPSIPSDSNTCLLAQNLNFDCYVNRYEGNFVEKGEEVWSIKVDDLTLAETIGKALRLKVDGYDVILPKKIARVAIGFDTVKDMFYETTQDEDDNEVGLAEVVERKTKYGYMTKYKLIEANLSPKEIRLVQTYWPYIKTSARKEFVKPTFV